MKAIGDLLIKIGKALGGGSVEVSEVIKEYAVTEIPASAMQVIIKSDIPKVKVEIWDNMFYIPSEVDCIEIIEDVCINMPKYKAERRDCENFAINFVSRVNEKYALNNFYIAVGSSPMGRHGYIYFVGTAPDGSLVRYILEPQTADIWPYDAGKGYVPDTLILA